MTPRDPIHTERLRLEPIGPEHAHGTWLAIESSLRELRPWLYWAQDNVLEQREAFTREMKEKWDESAWTFAICEGAEVIGVIGVEDFKAPLSSAELGYWLRTDRTGRGYMTEAGRAVIEFAFDRLGIHRIELHAHARNAPSIRVAERLGFRRVGVLRDGERTVEGWHDAYVFDLLAGEHRRGS